jgi:hypothetical protein
MVATEKILCPHEQMPLALASSKALKMALKNTP